MSNIVLAKDALDNIDMDGFRRYVDWTKSGEYFDKPAGQEMYRMIAHIARQMPSGSTLVDIGTYCGLSAVALAMNEACNVVTYDVCDQVPETTEGGSLSIRHLDNITFKIKDALTEPDVLSQAKIIVIDMEPHDGLQEAEMLATLRTLGFTGIVILDDIRLSAEMKAFWEAIPETKYDVTSYGHWSGSGVVCFSSAFTFTLV